MTKSEFMEKMWRLKNPAAIKIMCHALAADPRAEPEVRTLCLRLALGIDEADFEAANQELIAVGLAEMQWLN